LLKNKNKKPKKTCELEDGKTIALPTSQGERVGMLCRAWVHRPSALCWVHGQPARISYLSPSCLGCFGRTLTLCPQEHSGSEWSQRREVCFPSLSPQSLSICGCALDHSSLLTKSACVGLGLQGIWKAGGGEVCSVPLSTPQNACPTKQDGGLLERVHLDKRLRYCS
jgi:hypothetical protein